MPERASLMPTAQGGCNRARANGPGWASLLTGSTLAASGLAFGLVQRSWLRSGVGAGLAAGGGLLIYRGVNNARLRDICIAKSVTINKSPEDVYRFWKQIENLPLFMQHLQEVRRLDDRRSHWIASAPLGRTVEWDAELLEDDENRRLTWHSVSGSDIDHRGSVEFKPAPGNRGTEVDVRLEYRRPGRRAGKALAIAFFGHPERQVREDLRRFKSLVETGELPTTEGQPSGRRPTKIRTIQPFDREMFGNRRLNAQRAG